jgi:hypothetical protein
MHCTGVTFVTRVNKTIMPNDTPFHQPYRHAPVADVADELCVESAHTSLTQLRLTYCGMQDPVAIR